MAEGDVLWRRPEASAEQYETYSGPPTAQPAPPDWRPQAQESAPLPRKLPAIDDDAADEAEREAARFTHVIGLIAVVVLLALACWRAF